MPFIPHTADDVRDMLEAIGAPTTEALFDEIPAELRAKSLGGIPAALSEMEVGRMMLERAAADGGFPLRTRATSSVRSVVSRRPAGRWRSSDLPNRCRTAQGINHVP